MPNRWRTMSEKLFSKLDDDDLLELVRLLEEDPARLVHALRAYEVRRRATS